MFNYESKQIPGTLGPVYEISSQKLSSRIQLNKDQQAQKNAFIYDLEKLVKLDKSELYRAYVFGTSLYAQQFFSFQSKMQENFFHQQKIKKELDADRRLFREKVIAVREFERKYRIVMSEIPEYTARLISN